MNFQNIFFQGLIISKLAGTQGWNKSRSENSKHVRGKKHQTAQGATAEAREHLERAASASEVWHRAWEKKKGREEEEEKETKATDQNGKAFWPYKQRIPSLKSHQQQLL